ncbi:MAG TPA: DNA double-strand break repair nuclease NurA [Pyrodictium sp.]|nr:DNA double-strand break repair nuclease NurA [Pyrodictium sp.]
MNSERVLVFENIDEFFGNVAKLLGRARQLCDKLRDNVVEHAIIGKYREPPSSIKLAAIDTAFPMYPLELVSLAVSVIGYASIVVENDVVVEKYTGYKVIAGLGKLDQDIVAAYAREIERHIAEKLVSSGFNGIIIFDGEVVPIACRHSKVPESWARVCRLTERLLDYKNVLVGIVKRSFSFTLSRKLGLKMPDKAIMSLVLRRGEYAIVEKFANDRCLVVYYKPLKGLQQAIKVEVCGGVDQYRVSEIIGLLISSAASTGLPWYVDFVDGLAKRETQLLDLISSRLLRTAVEVETEQLVEPTNPQKT